MKAVKTLAELEALPVDSVVSVYGRDWVKRVGGYWWCQFEERALIGPSLWAQPYAGGNSFPGKNGLVLLFYAPGDLEILAKLGKLL